MRIIDKIKAGDKFGKLTYTGKFIRKGKHQRLYGLFDCECGTKNKPIFINNVTSGKQKACGCLYNNSVGLPSLEYKRINNIFQGMKIRCYDPSSDGYKYYGGRGIGICEEWINDISKFAEWAVRNGYNKKLTIERIDYDEDYSPQNCKWVSMKEQQRNKRSNIAFTHNGVTKCMMEWCEEIGIPHYLACNRYRRGKTSFDEVFYKGDLRRRLEF